MGYHGPVVMLRQVAWQWLPRITTLSTLVVASLRHGGDDADEDMAKRRVNTRYDGWRTGGSRPSAMSPRYVTHTIVTAGADDMVGCFVVKYR